MIAKATCDFTAGDERHLSLKKGVLVSVTDMDDPNWWEGTVRCVQARLRCACVRM